MRDATFRPWARSATLLPRVALTLVLVVAAPFAVFGQPPPADTEAGAVDGERAPQAERASGATDPAPIVAQSATLTVWNRPIAVFRAPYGAFSPAERAASAQGRIQSIPLDALDDPIEGREVSDDRQRGIVISGGAGVLFGLLEEDVDVHAGETLESTAEEAKRQLRALFDARLEQRRPAVVARAIGWALASLFLIAFGILASGRVRRWALARLERVQPRSFAVAGIDLWPFALGLGRGAIGVATRGAVLALAYVLVTITLRQLPYTRPWGEKLGGWVIELLRELMVDLIGSVPGVVVVILIYLATRFVVRTMDALLDASKSETATAIWLHPDTVDATRQIARVFVWLFAIVVAYPYIPGSSTTAFKGVSVFAGVVLSLGSSGLVNQILSGILLTYARALREGDLVQIGETFGVVTEMGVLSTKILTPTQQMITIPNTVMVSTSVVNFARAGALLSTTVTIGYDAPWRQVHSLLELAAGRTAGIAREPKPNVLQRALSDFYVEYELRCTLERQLERMKVLSELHSQIQDAFNEFGVQIMSPHFEGQPEGRVIAPKESWFSAPAAAATGAGGSGAAAPKAAARETPG
jgi:small-conductance mechanosensitive channel